jgi:isoquinoline 1-oxidoreductase alpha subunit
MELDVNGKTITIETEGDTPVLWVLRDLLGLTGTKYGCGAAACGACTILVDGSPIRACITPVSALAGVKITTIEGLAALPVGPALQESWDAHDVPQCGYCQSGQLMSAAALLTANPKPNDVAITDAMEGNICRCGTYGRIRKAISAAAEAIGSQN